jgi:hypothetical protein
MRRSIADLGTEFSTTRMVREYVERLYLPAHEGRLPEEALRELG